MADIHNISAGIILAIGFTAQLFFSLRTLFQWWKSEKAKKVVSPSAYWVLSVIGSYLFFVYGILRDDFSIVLGQLISYYIYLWNLNAKGIWKRLGLVLQTILLATPVVAVLLMIQDAQTALTACSAYDWYDSLESRLNAAISHAQSLPTKEQIDQQNNTTILPDDSSYPEDSTSYNW